MRKLTTNPGHPKFGYFINQLKCKANFPLAFSDGTTVPQISVVLQRNLNLSIVLYAHKTDNGAKAMPWCGFLINAETLEVHADYAKYLNGSTIISSEFH